MNTALIQARMGSSRLPGKTMKTINGKPLLAHLLDRIQRAELLSGIIIVTTDAAIDDPIDEFCQARRTPCFRGSVQDVLDRYYQAAIKFGLQSSNIVRITADCPLHSAEVVDFSINEFCSQKADYFTNSFEPVYEDGCDVYMFKCSALEDAWKNAKLPSEREHVIPYMQKNPALKKVYKKYREDYTYKLSVDTPNDFLAVGKIFEHFYPDELFTIDQVVDLLKKRPDILSINRESVINEGYQKSLLADKKASANG